MSKQPDREIEELLQEHLVLDHDDYDSNTCKSRYLICTSCMQEVYYMNVSTHAHKRQYMKEQPCDCSVSTDLAEAKQAIEALILKREEAAREEQIMQDELSLLALDLDVDESVIIQWRLDQLQALKGLSREDV